MAFTQTPATSLGVYGAPAGFVASPTTEAQTATDTLSVSITDSSSVAKTLVLSVTDTVSVSVTESSSLVIGEVNLYSTELRAYGGPGPYAQYAAAATIPVADITASDTLLVQIIEDPVSDQQIVTADSLRVSLADVSQLFNYLSVSDGLGVALSETISLVIAGITVIAVTDTLSVSLTESVALNVSLGVSDTLSVTLTDTSALATSTQAIDVTDTLSVSLSEVALLQVSAGIAQITVGDVLAVALTESADLVRTTPPEPGRPVTSIRFELSGPSMRFEFL